MSDLAFDIDSAKGSGLGILEEANSFAGQEMDVGASLLEELLATMVDNKLRSIFVVAKSKFIGNHADFHIWFVPIPLNR